MLTICECGFDCAEFISRHDIAQGARFECPACGDVRTAALAGVSSADVYGDANGVVVGEGHKHLTHDVR